MILTIKAPAATTARTGQSTAHIAPAVAQRAAAKPDSAAVAVKVAVIFAQSGAIKLISDEPTPVTTLFNVPSVELNNLVIPPALLIVDVNVTSCVAVLRTPLPKRKTPPAAILANAAMR